MPFVCTPELVGFQRRGIGEYDKGIPWPEWERARFAPRRSTRHADRGISSYIAGQKRRFPAFWKLIPGWIASSSDKGLNRPTKHGWIA
jgi:hypothetical protein